MYREILDFCSISIYTICRNQTFQCDFEVIFLSITLQTSQREQAGSDTYNRYEYQVHWIVCQVISRLTNNPNCIIFCEYHDDMAEMPNPDENVFEYYQIKTRDDGKEWSVVDLSKKHKRTDGSYKRSFLGFIFYNFMQFGSECSRCSFVSNAEMDIDIRTWQACIEDESILKEENPVLYSKIKQRISEEYGDSKPEDFEEIFDKFIQNTFVVTDSLKLNTYEDQTKGCFFTYLKNQKLPTNTAYLIFDQIINDVRNKSKEKIKAPISKKSLIAKKGIRVSDISTILQNESIKSDTYAEFRGFLNATGLLDSKIDTIVKGKIAHDIRWNDIEDLNYHACVLVIRNIIVKCIERNESNMQQIFQECSDALSQQSLVLSALDINLIEVL